MLLESQLEARENVGDFGERETRDAVLQGSGVLVPFATRTDLSLGGLKRRVPGIPLELIFLGNQKVLAVCSWKNQATWLNNLKNNWEPVEYQWRSTRIRELLLPPKQARAE